MCSLCLVNLTPYSNLLQAKIWSSLVAEMSPDLSLNFLNVVADKLLKSF